MSRPLATAIALLLALPAVACIDDNIPARPVIVAPVTDGGDAADGDASGADDGGPGDDALDDGGASDGGPVLLATATSCGEIKLVVSNGTLFWTESGTGMVKSVPTSGGRPTVIAANQMGPGAIAVDDTFVYWVYGQTMIRRRPLAGGNETVFVDPPPLPNVSGTNEENHINALLVARKTLFYGRFTYVYRIPTDGTTPQLIASSPMSDMGIAGAFALDPLHLYQVEMGHNAVTRELIDGTQDGLTETGAMEPLAPDRIAVSRSELVTDAIAIDDDYVVWANATGIESKLVDTLEHQGTLSVIANSAGFNPISGFVISGSFIFLGESSMDAVEVAPLVKGSDNVAPPLAQVIAPNQKDPGQFAADDQNVYWRTVQPNPSTGTTNCRIMKLTKP